MPTRVVWDDDEQIIADLIKRVRTLQARQTTTNVHGTHDEFTVAATPETTFQLTYIPVDGTVAMYVNGLEQEETTDYTVDYDTTSATVGLVTFVTALTTGDRINFRYLVTDWLVARSLPEDDGLIALAAPSTFDGELGGTDSGASGQIARSYTNQHDALLIVPVAWATGGNDPGGASISDTGGLTWTKEAESIKVWAGSPDTVGIAVFTARAPSTPTSGTVTVTVTAHAAFDVYPMVIPSATAAGDVASGHAATASDDRSGSTTLNLTLGTSPTASQGTMVFAANWPHKVVTEDAAYTEIVQNNSPGGGGPYGQELRFAYSYDYTTPDGTASVTSAAACESVAVMITITPDAY